MVIDFLHETITTILLWVEMGIILTLTAVVLSIIAIAIVRIMHLRHISYTFEHVLHAIRSSFIVVGCALLYGSGLFGLKESIDPISIGAIVVGYCVVGVFRMPKLLYYLSLFFLLITPISYIYDEKSLMYKSLLIYVVIFQMIAVIYSRSRISRHEND